jgi:hypothetical protein
MFSVQFDTPFRAAARFTAAPFGAVVRDQALQSRIDTPSRTGGGR